MSMCQVECFANSSFPGPHRYQSDRNAHSSHITVCERLQMQKDEVLLDTKVCDADAHITEGNKQNLDEDGCRSACLATQECKFYLHTAQLKQCELLKKCDRIGATGEKQTCKVGLDAFVALRNLTLRGIALV